MLQVPYQRYISPIIWCTAVHWTVKPNVLLFGAQQYSEAKCTVNLVV